MSTSINIQNYESFFLDFLEGNLPENLQAELLEFLANHPNLQDEFLALKQDFPTLEADSEEQLPDKWSFKKPEILNEEEGTVLDEKLIAYWENDLSDKERRALEKNVSTNAGLAALSAIYKRIRLKPDLSLGLKDKYAFKRHRILPLFNESVQKIYSAAAILVIMLLSGQAWLMLQRSGEQEDMAYTDERAYFSRGVSSPLTQSENKPAYALFQERGKQESQALQATERTPSVTTEASQVPSVTQTNRNTTRSQSLPEQRLMPRSASTLQLDPMPSVDLKQYASMRVRPSYLPENSENAGQSFSVREYLVYRFNRDVLRNDPSRIDTRDFSLYHLADASLNGLEKISKGRIEWKPSIDEEGELDYYAITTPLFQIKRQVKSDDE